MKQGNKWDDNKNRPHLMPPSLFLNKLDIYEYGACKYGKDNWRQGFAYSRLYDAALRHILAFWQGEDLDPESGLHHLLHAAWNIDTLWYQQKFDLGMDNRPKEHHSKQTIDSYGIPELPKDDCNMFDPIDYPPRRRNFDPDTFSKEG